MMIKFLEEERSSRKNSKTEGSSTKISGVRGVRKNENRWVYESLEVK